MNGGARKDGKGRNCEASSLFPSHFFAFPLHFALSLRRAPLSGLLRAMLLTDLYILLDKIIFKLLNLFQ